MSIIKISSPGKVILHGEHSVVYGKPALAAVVGVRTSLSLLKLGDSSSVLTFHLDSLRYSFEIQISEVNKFVEKYLLKVPSCLDKDLLLKETKNAVSAKFENENDVQVKTLHSIYYVLCGCFITAEKKFLECGWEIKISSELNIGAGLGSSASFGVSLAAAFLIMTNQISLNSYDSEKSLALVSSWAFESERVMHGNPSGLDNTICTYGGIVKFVKGKPFTRIDIPKPLNILLVDTKVTRSTAELVKKVSILKTTFPKLVDLIWDSMEEVVDAALPIYEDFEDEQSYCKLKQLFQINNDLLRAVGVSHESLERIFSITTNNKFSCKLTGAGGGGYAIVLLPSDYKVRDDFKNLSKELVESGFQITETTVSGKGLTITCET